MFWKKRRKEIETRGPELKVDISPEKSESEKMMDSPVIPASHGELIIQIEVPRDEGELKSISTVPVIGYVLKVASVIPLTVGGEINITADFVQFDREADREDITRLTSWAGGR